MLNVIAALSLAATLIISSPLAEVKNTIESLKTIVSDPDLKTRKQQRNKRIRALILERWDLEEMAKRALGRHWKTRTDAEREEYVDLFSQYVEVFYRQKVFNSVEFLENAEQKMDIYYKERNVESEFAEVEIQIVTKNNSRMSFLLKLHLKDGHWKAYDVVVENISEVNNWRAQFDRVITRHSFGELLKRLREKIKELDK